MFTVFVVAPKDVQSSSSSSSCPHRPTFDDYHGKRHYGRWHRQEQRHQRTRDARASRPAAHSLLDTLQSSIFFGGIGSLSREVEAMERQLVAEAVARSSANSITQQQYRHNQQDQHQDGLWPQTMLSRDDVMGLTTTTKEKSSQENDAAFSWINSMFPKSSTVLPLKRYKITVEELKDTPQTGTEDDIDQQLRLSEDGKENPPLLVSTTASMPPSLVQWLMHAVHHEQDGSSEQGSWQPVQDTRDDKSIAHDAFVNSTTATSEGIQPPSASSTTMLPSPSVDAKDTDHGLAAAVAVSTAALVAASASAKEDKKLENSDPEWTQRSWPPRRRASSHNESFTRTTITRPDGTVESKTITLDRETGIAETHAKIQHPDGSIQESVVHENKPKSWSTIRQMKQQQQREGEQVVEHLQVCTPVQGNAAVPVKPKSDVGTMIKTVAEEESSPAFPPSSIRERFVERRQERADRWQEIRAERRKEKQERRQELREAEARQREMIAAAYGFGFDKDLQPAVGLTREDLGYGQETSTSTTTRQEEANVRGEDPHRSRVEFHRHHEPHVRRGWHERREARERLRREVEEVEQEGPRRGRREKQEQHGARDRSWPPKGYLRRLEKEQEQEREPRHNV